MSLASETKTNLVNAVADLEAGIENLGAAWTRVVQAYEAARDDFGSFDRGLHDFQNTLSIGQIRHLVLSCGRVHGLSWLLEGIGTADGTTLQHDGERPRPDGDANIKSAVEHALERF